MTKETNTMSAEEFNVLAEKQTAYERQKALFGETSALEMKQFWQLGYSYSAASKDKEIQELKNKHADYLNNEVARMATIIYEKNQQLKDITEAIGEIRALANFTQAEEIPGEAFIEEIIEICDKALSKGGHGE